MKGTQVAPGVTTDRKRRNGAPSPVARRASTRKLIAFGWYGGKYSHLDWLLPLLPQCRHYCEPFAGSGAVEAMFI